MKKILFLILLTVHFCGFSQKKFDFRFWEDSLIHLRDAVMQNPNELERFALNEDFMNLLEWVLEEPNAFKFTWDSVRNFSVTTSPDKFFKLYTWYVTKDNLSVENFGFLQLYNDSRKKYVLYPLYDKRNMMDYPGDVIGDHNAWYGAVYYDIIPLQTKNRTYYTLLGWNGNNLFSNQKIIEILHFKKNLSPVFGAKIFRKYPEKVARVILEYNKDASLSLKYERHAYEVNTGKRDPKTKKMIYESIENDMIIFDQLVPMTDGIRSIPAFLVPESSINRGFIPKDGYWEYIENVKGRNPDRKMPSHQQKQRIYYQPQTN